MKGDKRFVASMLLPTFFFLICFYAYPTLYNLMNSFTDLSLFGMRKGGAWVGFENYWELLTSRDFRSVLWNTVVWLTFVGVRCASFSAWRWPSCSTAGRSGSIG